MLSSNHQTPYHSSTLCRLYDRNYFSVIRRRSHYGDSMITFCQLYFTFRTMTITFSLPYCEHYQDNGCLGDSNGDGRKKGMSEVKANVAP